jgi:hypothetical protein
MQQARYDAFISYSHAADGNTASQLQRAMQRIAKPWYRLHGMRVFRDETDLSVTPEGWQDIQAALDRSRFLLVMASQQAAASKWVAMEITHWLERRPASTLLIVLTDGEIVWDAERGDFDWQRTTALPRQVAGAFHSEPFWADLRWTTEQQVLTLRNPEFLKAVAKLAAPIRDLDVASLVSEDHRQHRRTMRVAWTMVLALMAILFVAAWQYRSRLAADERERDQRVLAAVARAYQVLYVDPLRAVDEARQALDVKRSAQGEEALNVALRVAALRQESRQVERAVLGSGVGYLMERWRRGEVFTRLRNDGRFALVATERGKDGPDPPGTAYLIALDNLRTIELVAGDQAAGRRLEYIGFSTSGEQVFVARQFYLDIFDLTGARTSSVQLEYHAKPTHLIAGLFGSYVLVGDTVGNLMLADTKSSARPQLRGSRYLDAALFIESNAQRPRAIVVFESGKSELVVLDDPNAASEFELGTKDSIAVAFSPTADVDRFVTASKSGQVDVWEFDGGPPTRLASFDHGGVPVGLASFSSGGERAISLGGDGTVKVWDVAGRTLLATFPQTSGQ